MTAELARSSLGPRMRERRAAAAPAARDLNRAELSALLASAAAGDVDAFMAFYDATGGTAWRLELKRHSDRELARDATCRRYVRAWVRAADQRPSGLSPTAWLLSLQDPEEVVR